MAEATADGPVEVIRKRMKELRRKRGMTAAQLGEAMAVVGVPWDRSIVANFESGRRETVSVVEFLALAHVLNTAPVHLLAPVEDDVPYRTTPTLTQPSQVAREWIRGYSATPRSKVLEYFAEAPESERGALEQWWRSGDRVVVELKALTDRWDAQNAAVDARLKQQLEQEQRLIEQERRVTERHEEMKALWEQRAPLLQTIERGLEQGRVTVVHADGSVTLELESEEGRDDG